MKKPDATPRIVRAELVIATLALLASSCASIAALIQTRATVDQTKTIAEQFGASVWPYVTFNSDFVATRAFSFSIVNQGLGPALIRSFDLSIDHRATRHWRDVAALIDPHPKKRSVGEGDVGAGSVLRPGQTFTLFTVDDRGLDRRTENRTMERVVARVCYCSLLRDCWMLESSESEPRGVPDCSAQRGKVDL